MRKDPYVRVRRDTGQYRRILLTGIFLGVLAFIPVVARLYRLMVKDHSYYAQLALRNQTRATQIPATRGVIYDRNGNILACNQGVETVYLNPQELKQAGVDIEAVCRFLGGLLEKDPQWILTQARDTTMRYKQIAAQVEAETAGQLRSYIKENRISGIHIEPATRRVYPYGSMASQLIGFTNASGVGSEGVEAAYNSYLLGSAGSVITTKGSNEMDMPFSYEDYLPSLEGCSVTLTLDAVVQACLEKQMQTAIDRYAVQNGAFGLVMDVDTGEILAMATLPSFDPNDYLKIYDQQQAYRLEQQRLAYIMLPGDSQGFRDGQKRYLEALQAAQLKQWRNRCISDGYEPGSTFKVLTMAAALDCGAIDLETDFHCSGAEQIPGRAQLLHCWRSTGHGAQKTPQALQNSCNLAFAHIALKLGGERFYDYVQRFGILEKTGIDLAGESKGVFFDKALVTQTEKWGTASLTSGSFGQTFKLTPLQLVRGIAAVVNGGRLIEPYVVSQVEDASGSVVLQQETTVLRQVISPDTSGVMCRLLHSVVEEGTAKNAKVSGFSVGGKTGTSEKIDVFDENGQRVQDKIVSFVGIAPMDDPRYIVLVALDTPARSTGMYISGGVMAAPTVGAVLEDILPYLEVSGDSSTAQPPVLVESYEGLTLEQARQKLKDKGIACRAVGSQRYVTGQIPAPGRELPAGGEVILYFGEAPREEPVTVPDFSAMTRQQASDTAGKLGLFVLPKGNTEIAPNVRVIGQSVAAGSEICRGSLVELTFADTDVRD